LNLEEKKIMTDFLIDRTEAGQLLANRLTHYADRADVLVLALPRGGVPIAYEIATKLHLPLDVCLVRKLGVPKQQELAMGAIATGNVVKINRDIVEWSNVSRDAIEQTIEREKEELERRDRTYRGERPLPQIRDRSIILVDDGIATGATIRAAIATLQQQQPQEIVIAVPVASPAVCRSLATEANKIICLIKPESLQSISLWYEDFSQTSDKEVRDLLAKAERELAALR
jgi:putative phosphoribosyl transferase